MARPFSVQIALSFATTTELAPDGSDNVTSTLSSSSKVWWTQMNYNIQFTTFDVRKRTSPKAVTNERWNEMPPFCAVVHKSFPFVLCFKLWESDPCSAPRNEIWKISGHWTENYLELSCEIFWILVYFLDAQLRCGFSQELPEMKRKRLISDL